MPSYRVEACGELVFVSLSATVERLAEFLGPYYAGCQERFGSQWSGFLAWDVEYAANWKIVVENSLEAYHVPYIHAHTFGEDPGEARSDHLLAERHTALTTNLPFNAHSRVDSWFQKSEGWFLRRLGIDTTGQYQQHHLFPNLLFSFTDAVSLCHMVIPTGPTTSRAVVRQFGRNARQQNPAARILASGWGRLAAQVTRRILEEDRSLFRDIQRGTESSLHRGVLGRCEERIYAFQQYLRRACQLDNAAVSTICSESNLP